jgi:hypothetical protein
MTEEELRMLRQLPFRVYSPSRGGGRQWASLINGGFVTVRDVGSDEGQETILLLEATKTGHAALTKGGGQ